MKYCTNCGGELEEGVKFCGYCGTPVPTETGFNLSDHISNLQKNGMLVVNNDQKIETKKWDKERYIKNIFTSIVSGGFTYFTYGEAIDEAEFTRGVILKSKDKKEVRKKIPLLLSDESLELLGNVKRIGIFGTHGGTTYGPLYYTGRRFILETVEFETETHMGHEPDFSLPLISYWIKPDFTTLLKKIDCEFILQEGMVRKKSYDDLGFVVLDIKKPSMFAAKMLRCGYMLSGRDGEKFYDYYIQQIQNLDEAPIEEFSVKIEKMIKDSKTTEVSRLIEHTHGFKENQDVFIESSLAYMGKNITEGPYSLTGRIGILV